MAFTSGLEHVLYTLHVVVAAFVFVCVYVVVGFRLSSGGLRPDPPVAVSPHVLQVNKSNTNFPNPTRAPFVFVLYVSKKQRQQDKAGFLFVSNRITLIPQDCSSPPTCLDLPRLA